MEEKSRKPEDTPFKQQKLKAWQPILTPNWVIGTFAVVGLIFIPIGIILHTESENVVEYSIQYDGKNTPDSANIAKLGKGCFLESDADRDSFDLASRGCLVSFQIEKDMKGPVFVYYQLDNFYQNHRRYVQSRSDAQLRGDAKASTSDCSPLTEAKNVIKYNSTSSTPLVPTNGTYTVNPCGLIANSLFNDIYWINSVTKKDGTKLYQTDMYDANTRVVDLLDQSNIAGDHDIDPALILAHLKSCPVPHPATETAAVASAEEEKEADDSTTTPIALPLSNSRFLAIEYITQVILHDRVSVVPRLHDDAVYLLLDAIHAELENGGTASSSTALSPLARLAPRVSSQRGLLGLLRRKLMAFLECARAQFHPERMLSRTPHEMVDERAALLSRLGRHHEVLQLYALQLRDAALAEAYCNKCYESKYADSSIYSTLLRLYLRPMRATSSTSIVGSSSSPPKPLWQRSTSLQVPATGAGGGTMATSPSEAVTAAINVLNKYAERIDVATALDLLPSDVPVAALATFFRRVLEHQVERYRNGQIKMQLAKMENFKVRDKLTSKRKESVTVWSSHCCHVCGKKLGVGTFVRLPQVGGTVTLVHFSCQPVGETRPAVGTLGTW